MNEERKIPKFVTDLTNYLIAIKNLSQIYVKNMTIDELKQEKIAMLKYTYEQVLSSQAEQVNSKANNLDNLSSFGKLLSKDFGQSQLNNNLKVI